MNGKYSIFDCLNVAFFKATKRQKNMWKNEGQPDLP